MRLITYSWKIFLWVEEIMQYVEGYSFWVWVAYLGFPF